MDNDNLVGKEVYVLHKPVYDTLMDYLMDQPEEAVQGLIQLLSALPIATINKTDK